MPNQEDNMALIEPEGRRVAPRATAGQMLIIALILIAVILGLGVLSMTLGNVFVFQDDAESQIVARLQKMAILAVLIERSVEVYLNLSSQNGPERHDPTADRTQPSAAPVAAAASLTLSLLVAFVGVRILGSAGETVPTQINEFGRHIWIGVDILISAGLMAGGSSLIHEVAETIKSGVRSVDRRIAPKQ